MPAHAVESFDDPRLAAYRNMKDKELARDGERFIAEGENVVRRLLASGLRVESVLVADRKRAILEPLVPGDVPLYYAGDPIIARIIGFEFHSGVLACGIRPGSPALRELIPPAPRPALIVACQQITNTENMGSLIRVSAAFGADAMLLGEHCCDPYFRQSVRVSMGAIFSLPIVRSSNLVADLHQLRLMQILRVAAVLGNNASPLRGVQPRSRIAVIFGNEANGLDSQTIAACDECARVPMKRGIDSLNVAIAAAVFLYHFTNIS